MNELLNWLLQQKGSLRTYVEFQDRALALRADAPEHAALLRLLADLAGRFVEAYDRLAAEGLIRARQGSGFYVTGGGLPPLALTQAASPQELAVDPFWVSRQSLDAEPGALKPGCGWLPPDWMPDEALRRGFRALARADGAILTDYGGTRGASVLRRLLLGRFAELFTFDVTDADDAVKAKMRFSPAGVVQVKGEALRLSPGAQIRDTSNRIVLPSHISGDYTVRMLLDKGGQVHRVWILTPEEAAMPEPKR